MKFTKLLLFLFFSLIQFKSFAGKLTGTTINICEDKEEWPPYSYYKRDPIGKPTKKIIGMSLDIAEDILKKEDAKVTIVFLPWARCLEEIKKGKNYQMALNASYSKKREQEYVMSKSIYEASSAYFYLKKKFPKGPDIKTIADFKKFSVCGLLGYNYSYYGLDKDSPNLEQTSSNFEQVFQKIKKGHCDLFIEKKEIMVGMAKIGRNFINDPEIGYQKVPQEAPVTFHFIFSKNWSRSQEVVHIVNIQVAKMRKNGEMNSYLKKYGLL